MKVKPLVLIVDDEEYNRNLFNRLLRRDYRVGMCSGITEARKRIASEEVTVLIVDARLEDGNGIQFLTDNEAELPRCVLKILISGDPEIEARRKDLYACGIDYFLGKPFDHAELMEYLQKNVVCHKGNVRT